MIFLCQLCPILKSLLTLFVTHEFTPVLFSFGSFSLLPCSLPWSVFDPTSPLSAFFATLQTFNLTPLFLDPLHLQVPLKQRPRISSLRNGEFPNVVMANNFCITRRSITGQQTIENPDSPTHLGKHLSLSANSVQPQTYRKPELRKCKQKAKRLGQLLIRLF